MEAVDIIKNFEKHLPMALNSPELQKFLDIIHPLACNFVFFIDVSGYRHVMKILTEKSFNEEINNYVKTISLKTVVIKYANDIPEVYDIFTTGPGFTTTDKKFVKNIRFASKSVYEIFQIPGFENKISITDLIKLKKMLEILNT